VDDAHELIGRLLDSIGEAIYEDTTGLANPPAPRESWVDLQQEVVALAPSLTGNARTEVARALLRAVLDQPSYGPRNRLEPLAFAFLLDTLGDQLAAALDRSAGHQCGGRRYLREHAWTIPGDEGARWLAHLAAADDIHTNFLFQDMRAGNVPRWADEDWAARLDVIASLPAEPRPGITTVLFLGNPPREATPALVRVALAHGVDERDGVVRYVAGVLSAFRRPQPSDDVDLVDWSDRRRRADLFRWVLELMGEAGYRERLVRAAVSAGLVSQDDAAYLAAPLDRPAWADGEVPWVVDEVNSIGTVRLPSKVLTAGDPWWTGGAEGFPWTVALEVPEIVVGVAVAQHPLVGRQCAALIAHVSDGIVQKWQLIGGALEAEGYTVEVGVAGFGSVDCYESGAVFDLTDDFVGRTPPAWHLLDGGQAGAIAMCSVGPQHQLCRTWIGSSADGVVVTLVTDLGLLNLDLERDPTLPW
jgi:hypothetical protein